MGEQAGAFFSADQGPEQGTVGEDLMGLFFFLLFLYNAFREKYFSSPHNILNICFPGECLNV